MANVLTVSNSGLISFDSRSFPDLTVPPLSSSARISYDNGGGVNVTSYTTAATALDRFTVDGTQGRLFSVSDVLTGTLFSVNDITGLPILEVTDNDTVIAGKFNSNTLFVSGTQVSIGNTPFSTAKLGVSGDLTVVGLISAGSGNSNLWNSTHTTVQSNSANWNTAFNHSTVFATTSGRYNNVSTAVEANSANWQKTYTTVQGNSASWITANAVVVSGAGEASVNGFYTETGIFGEKNYYNLVGVTNTSFDVGAITWSQGTSAWTIWDYNNDRIYESVENVQYPWEVTTWTDVQGGNLPLPKLKSAYWTPVSEIIMNSDTGNTKWRITIDDDGILTTTAI